MGEVQAKLLAKPYNVVLLAGARNFGGDMAALQNALAPIAAAGSRIIFVADDPSVTKESLACLTRATAGNGQVGDCGTPRAEALALPDKMTAAASLVAGSTLIDMTDYFCNADRCPSVIGNVVVYTDKAAHITGAFAQTLQTPLADGIRRALPQNNAAKPEANPDPRSGPISSPEPEPAPSRPVATAGPGPSLIQTATAAAGNVLCKCSQSHPDASTSSIMPGSAQSTT
jgi:hypothetical protein